METLKKLIASAIICGLTIASTNNCAARQVPVTAVVKKIQSVRPTVSAALNQYAELVFTVGDESDQEKARHLLPRIARARVLLLGAEMALVETINRVGATPEEVEAAWSATEANLRRLQSVAADLPVSDPVYAKRVGGFLIAVSLAGSLLQANYATYETGGVRLELDGYSVIEWYDELKIRHGLEPLLPAKTFAKNGDLTTMYCELMQAVCRQTGGSLADCYADFCRCVPDCALPSPEL